MKGFRWKVMGFIFIAYILNFMDRSALSYAIQPLQDKFGLNNAQFGVLYAAFGVSYLIMTLVGGVLVDSYGSRKILSIFAGLWSVVSAMMALATGFISILILRVALGCAEGPAFPALTRVAADWLPQNERARALAISLAAIPLASVIGAPFISNLIVLFGWQQMFITLGSLGLVWAVLWYILFRDQPHQCCYVGAQELAEIQVQPVIHPNQASLRAFLSYLSEQPKLWLAYLAYFVLGYLLSFSVSWWPGYLHQSFGLALKEIGWLLSLPWLLATLGILLGGRLSDRLWNKTQCIQKSRFNLIIFCQLCCGLAFIPLLYTHSLSWALLSISLGIGFGLMPISAFYAINSDLAIEFAGTSQGLMSSCLGLASFIAPALSGYLIQTQGHFHQAIMVIIGLMLLSSLALGMEGWRQRVKWCQSS